MFGRSAEVVAEYNPGNRTMENNENTNGCNTSIVEESSKTPVIKGLSGESCAEKTSIAPKSRTSSAKKSKRTKIPFCTTPTSPASGPLRSIASSPGDFISPNGSMLSMGSSCSSTRDSARIAKLQSTAERRQKVEFLKEKWRREKEERSQMNKDKRLLEIQRLHDQNQKASAERKESMEKKRQFEAQERAKQKELLSSSLQEKHQMLTSAQQMEREKRRKSVLLNEKIREAGKERAALATQKARQKERLEVEMRRIDYLEAKQKKKLDENRKRESLQFRAEQHKLHSSKNSALICEEEDQNLLEARRQNWQDEQKYKQQEQLRKRESTVFRLNRWRLEKTYEQHKKEQHAAQEQLDLLLRQEDLKSVAAYRRSQQQRDRQSLHGRLQKWRDDSATEKEQEQQRREALEIELELQRQEQADVSAYKATLQRSKRQSLAFRLDEASRGKSWEAGKQAFEQEIKDEERRIAADDREDVEQYRKKLAEDRRKSVQYRNTVAQQERLRQQVDEQLQKEAAREEAAIAAATWQDVREYLEMQRNEARKSLSQRLAESKRIREQQMEEHQQQINAAMREIEMRRIDMDEQREFRKVEATRSRHSIAMRLASWKDDQLQQEKEKAKASALAEEEALLREQDRDDLHAAKLAMEMIERRALISTSTSFMHT